MFEVLTARFDFDRNLLSLFIQPHPPLNIPAPAITLPMKDDPEGLLFNTSLTLPGTQPISFRIDTGSDSSIIPLNKAEKLQSLTTADTEYTDLGGTHPAKEVLLEQLTLGTLNLPMVTVKTV